MNCIQDDMLLEQYIDDALDTEQFATVEAAVQSCEHCRDYVDDAKVLRSALKESIAAAVDAAPLDTLWERIEKQLDVDEVKLRETSGMASPGPFERLKEWIYPRRLQLSFALCASVIVGIMIYNMTNIEAEQNNPQTAVAMSVTTVKNTLVIESLDVTQGTIVIDADPSEDMPTIVWHFVDDEQEGS